MSEFSQAPTLEPTEHPSQAATRCLFAPARLAPEAGAAVSGQPPEHPVFVTLDGRPRQRPRWAAGAVAATVTAWVAAVVVGGSGFASLPALQVAPILHRAFAGRAHSSAAFAHASQSAHRATFKLHGHRELAPTPARDSESAIT